MAWKIINDIQVDKENEPPIDFETCKKICKKDEFKVNFRWAEHVIRIAYIEDVEQAIDISSKDQKIVEANYYVLCTKEKAKELLKAIAPIIGASFIDKNKKL